MITFSWKDMVNVHVMDLQIPFPEKQAFSKMQEKCFLEVDAAFTHWLNTKRMKIYFLKITY